MKDTNVFVSGRSNFSALLSSDEDETGNSGKGLLSLVETATNDQFSAIQGEPQVASEGAAEPQGEADGWLPVVAGKKQNKKESNHKEGISSNPGTGRGNFPHGNKPVLPHGHHHSHHHHQANVQLKKSSSALPPLTLKEICAETSLELYGFPSKYRTGNLRKFVESGVESAGYRLKWQNDSSCWVVFDQPEDLKKAVETLKDEFIQVRQFAQENLLITEESMVSCSTQATPTTTENPVDASAN